MKSKQEDLQKEKPRRLSFVKFVALDYRIYAPPASAEEAGKVFQDLLVSIFENKDPKYPVNKAAVDEAREYIGNKRKRIEAWKKKKEQEAAGARG